MKNGLLCNLCSLLFLATPVDFIQPKSDNCLGNYQENDYVSEVAPIMQRSDWLVFPSEHGAKKISDELE